VTTPIAPEVESDPQRFRDGLRDVDAVRLGGRLELRERLRALSPDVFDGVLELELVAVADRRPQHVQTLAPSARSNRAASDDD